MTTPRERLRKAAADLAESLYDLLRADLLAGAVARPAEATAAKPPIPAARTSAPAGVSRVDTLAAWLREHGPATPGELRTGLKWRNSSLFEVIKQALARGLVAKRVEGRLVQYFVAGAEPPSRASAPADDQREAESPEEAASPSEAPRARPRRDDSPIDGLVREVAAFIAAHPNCRYGEVRRAVTASEGRLDAALKEARARGLVRLEGVKIKSRYFPVTPEAPSAESDEVSAVVPVETPRAPASRPPSVAPPRVAPTYDARDASPPEVLAVLNELELALAEDMHDIRLGAVLQAIVADVRALQARFPEGHPARRRLDGTIRRITAIRAERGLGFINGLKRDAHANWHLVARDARKKIAAFDADAEVGAPKARTPKPPKAKVAPAPHDELEQPLPNLIALTAERPVILVGGIKKNEVLEQVRAHHGLEVEWAAMQGTNARAADHLYERIKHGRVGAVVILEGLTGTTQIKAIVEACKAAGLPFAYGGRAGTESLRSALTELETRAAGAA